MALLSYDLVQDILEVADEYSKKQAQRLEQFTTADSKTSGVDFQAQPKSASEEPDGGE